MPEETSLSELAVHIKDRMVSWKLHTRERSRSWRAWFINEGHEFLEHLTQGFAENLSDMDQWFNEHLGPMQPCHYDSDTALDDHDDTADSNNEDENEKEGEMRKDDKKLPPISEILPEMPIASDRMSNVSLGESFEWVEEEH
jgi:hypothetical protein